MLLSAWATLSTSTSATATDWRHPLYLDGGGYWHQRVSVTVRNESTEPMRGTPVSVPIGAKSGMANLVGTRAEAVRVVNAKGEEMLFELLDPLGWAVQKGPIRESDKISATPLYGQLMIPVECEPKSSATYDVYFDNPSAWAVPDFLEASGGLVNGDVEAGRGDAPTGWKHDEPDESHRATWSDERPQSGKKCLKTVAAAGAEPTWIATRQSGIRIQGGARYIMKAYVRADNVQGQVGWYIHVGNRKNPMLDSPMLNAGQGTFDWKQVTAEFTAPAEADAADLGTVLRGTGTAWFDNVTLECLDEGKTQTVVTVGPVERMNAKEIGADAAWPKAGPEHRAVVRLVNLSDAPIEQTQASVDLAMLEARTRGKLDRGSLRVMLAGKDAPHAARSDRLMWTASLPARSILTFDIYFSDSAQAPGAPKSTVGHRGLENLLRNPGFEAGKDLPEGWSGPGGPEPGVTYGFDDPKKEGLGKRCAKLEVDAKASLNWRGWKQDVPVRPGRTYLLEGEIKCDLPSGNAQIHAHWLKADGSLCASGAMTGIGPPIEGKTDWTRLSGTLVAPADAAKLQIHLTMNQAGTIWHDDLFVSEVLPATIAGIEHRPSSKPAPLTAWQVPAIVKVFPDDGPPRLAKSAAIALARNEREPLQLSVRGPKALKDVQVVVGPITGPAGAKLPIVEVGVVGYVPIDHPTNYYQSTTPAYYRKFPNGGAGSDGWAGLWPDPLLPRDRFDLAADTTQPIWVTVGTNKDTPPGDYRGTAHFIQNGALVLDMPFTAHVWGFTLPDESHVKAIYDVSLGPGGEKWWQKSAGQAYPEIIEFMARHRTSPDRIQPEPRFRYENGQASADFSAYDKAAEHYFNELKLSHSYMPHLFYEFGWGFPPKDFFGEHPYPGDPPFEKADRSQLRPEYKKAYQACLKLFLDHVTQKGWLDKYVLYISDEPFFQEKPIRDQMKALCAMIYEVDPKAPIYSSTWHHVPDWDGSISVWGIGHYGVVPTAKMAEIKAGGAKLWFTTDGHMCIDTPYCAVERLLPHYCFRYGALAYEFWSVGWLTYDPYQFGWHTYIHQSDAPGKSYYVRYPNGDGFLIYPGAPIGHAGPVSSIRLEQAREGVEDYEYLYLLRELVQKAKSSGRNIAEAQRALDSADAMVPIPNAGGRYATKVLPDPEAVYRVRKGVAEAIEGLKKSAK